MARVEVRATLPPFTLTDPQGRRVSLRNLKGLRQAAIFLFHGGECAACRQKLREFASAADRYATFPAAVIAVPLDPRTDLAGLSRDLQLNFSLVHDPDGALIDRFAPADPRTGRRAPCCVVADAFGEIYAILRGEDAVRQSEILNWMEFIEMQCPE